MTKHDVGIFQGATTIAGVNQHFHNEDVVKIFFIGPIGIGKTTLAKVCKKAIEEYCNKTTFENGPARPMNVAIFDEIDLNSSKGRSQFKRLAGV